MVSVLCFTGVTESELRAISYGNPIRGSFGRVSAYAQSCRALSFSHSRALRLQPALGGDFRVRRGLLGIAPRVPGQLATLRPVIRAPAAPVGLRRSFPTSA